MTHRPQRPSTYRPPRDGIRVVRVRRELDAIEAELPDDADAAEAVRAVLARIRSALDREPFQ